MKVWRSGTTLWWRANSRTSSRLGCTSISAATGIQLLERVRYRQIARGEQHREVVEHVGGLLAHARVRLRGGRACDLIGLLAHLVPDARPVGEQLGRVAA